MSLEVSIIISTYNRPRALSLVLQNICMQIDERCEIIVADDGSTIETQRCICKIKEEFPNCKIHHVWQSDEGFRLARIRNLAVKKASGEYLIFLDGDCIPSSQYYKKHKLLREKGWLVYGQRILTKKNFCEKLENTFTKLKNGLMIDLLFIINHKIAGNINRVSPGFYWPFNLFRKNNSENWKGIRGCNWAMWKSDYEKVNGSDESFQGWGSEDKDLAVRLLNSGVKIKNGRFGPYVLHLWHKQESRENDLAKIEIVELRRKGNCILPTKGMYP